MYIKRKRVSRNTKPYNRRYKKASKRGTTGYAGIMRASMLSKRVKRIESTIETKEQTIAPASNVQLAHNALHYLIDPFGTFAQGVTDPMNTGGNHIGDKVAIKGIYFIGQLQNVAHRPKVFYRLMLLKYAKGDTPTRATLFKGCSGNKMIDQINTERYNIVAQRVLTVTAQGANAYTYVDTDGQPDTNAGVGAIGTKIVRIWVPGNKLVRNGNMQFESGSAQPKFFDYRWAILAYDWFGTLQDTNIVGSITDCYSKMYFKDA